ncbi:1-aminocyclopropane-1-carboxylate deaminase/D-cysteine desulfhydrase-like pyridoxal-dependent ACC family enzyme [Algoriphagus boseongensis]|uniref:1-aminocyclopropane-1-carboxylate deaminase/D-cysteine desulfhydrase-like pyridoxal-dependent ACC family enzyme n=2 Tax=Algoriphagus boseongensis TaxID=1442587 RepID=A0A4R6T1Y3_9BACT|nr:1-aminocyclopropane-1-carboxylate deaminase/D-cysteine desulfhydrase-like pyridoxal-dependent ACC family enzyme [Algoriphagus boseongensis]
MLLPSTTEIQFLSHQILQEKKVELGILRLDKIHNQVSGNKFFKLKYNLKEAKRLGKKTILTFGGAYSNHIYATAAAAKLAGLNSIGIIRGDGFDENNPTLSYGRNQGMNLHFVDREKYRAKTSKQFLEELKGIFGDFYLIPEGGTNHFAIQGTKEILTSSTHESTHICTSVGTGGTFVGLATSIRSGQELLGFSSLKGEFIRDEIQALLKEFEINPQGKIELITQYHFGGYAKWKPELIEFLHWFHSEFGIAIDPVYTGKMAYGIWELFKKDYFPPNSKILMIHTGGLQGNLGFVQRTGIAIPLG